jgi:hypothetical protein
MTLSIPSILTSVDVMTDELESVWKEAIGAQSRYYPSICLDGLRKLQKTLGRTTSVPTEFRTRRLQNTRLERCL